MDPIVLRPVLPLFLFAACMFFATPAPSETMSTPPDAFLTWTDEHGVVSFTDNPKQVPEKYRAAATKTTWNELAKRSAPRETLVKESETKMYFPAPPPDPAQNPNRLNDCSGPITIEQDWVQQGAYTREMITVRDECGRAVSFTHQEPLIHIGR